MRSVARLLKEYGFEVNQQRLGRWEVKSTETKWTHTFPNDTELWRWVYVMAMDSVDQA